MALRDGQKSFAGGSAACDVCNAADNVKRVGVVISDNRVHTDASLEH